MSEVLSWADAHISAAHRAVGGGRLHGHTWRVRAFWRADGRDAVQLKAKLREVCYVLDHDELPEHLSRAESLASYIGSKIDAAIVEVWREPEGLGARWAA